jgi:hypothetical protein
LAQRADPPQFAAQPLEHRGCDAALAIVRLDGLVE